MERLDKFLAEMGLGTRSQVKQYVKKGQVVVNGMPQLKPEYKIEPGVDTVIFQGREIGYAAYEYYMLYKPAGCVSASRDSREKTVVDLISDRKRKDLFPVGRLDKDTEGLLLIINDGPLAHDLLSPKKHVDKTYYAELQRPVTEEEKYRLEQGISIGDETLTLPAKLSFPEESRQKVLLTIREGRYHQVKRMFEACQNQVLYLKRISMGSLILDPELKKGEYRALSAEEVERLKGQIHA